MVRTTVVKPNKSRVMDVTNTLHQRLFGLFKKMDVLVWIHLTTFLNRGDGRRIVTVWSPVAQETRRTETVPRSHV